ncbi:MAG: ABC transporter ATP-binding protein [Pseudothermotoga sp.]|nr:ABC transporter ATP-binding protein [Pseudothermotoga sp.]
METAVVVRDLRREYVVKRGIFGKPIKKIEALKGISFEVKKGEIFGILGPNGAGKTTTIKILTTLLLPTSGEAYVLGYDVKKHTKEIRKRINLVMGGERNLYQRLSAIENLEYFADLYGLPVRGRKEKILSLIELVGLPRSRINDRVETYSKGMKQRLQIARALLNDPDVLFLDEPTVGLDPAGARALRKLVKEIRDQGKTVILTTHHMYEAEELCDRIAFLKEGSILMIDTPEAFKRTHSEHFEVRVVARRVNKEVLEKIKSCPFVVDIASQMVDIGMKITVKIEPSSEFLPEIFKYFQDTDVIDVSVKKSTLEDVYMKLLGEDDG